MPGNNRKEFTVTFSAADILIVADALSVGSATALMCGSKGAQKRLEELRGQFRAMSPLPKSDRSEGYAWFSACTALRHARWFEAYAESKEGYHNRGKSNIVVQIDDRRFTVSNDIPSDEAASALPAINEFLSEVCDLDVQQLVRIEVELTLEEDGRSRRGDDLMRSVSAAGEALFPPDVRFYIREARMDYSKGGDCVRAILSVPEGEADRVRELAAHGVNEVETGGTAAPGR